MARTRKSSTTHRKSHQVPGGGFAQCEAKLAARDQLRTRTTNMSVEVSPANDKPPHLADFAMLPSLVHGGIATGQEADAIACGRARGKAQFIVLDLANLREREHLVPTLAVAWIHATIPSRLHTGRRVLRAFNDAHRHGRFAPARTYLGSQHVKALT